LIVQRRVILGLAREKSGGALLTMA
jgi:hypothetical protein